MSASQIPNLNTLRRGVGRGRSRGRASSSAPTDSSGRDKDQLVQQTDNDASVSRLSAVELGYLHDPFAKVLAGNNAGSRRYPIINRGSRIFLSFWLRYLIRARLTNAKLCCPIDRNICTNHSNRYPGRTILGTGTPEWRPKADHFSGRGIRHAAIPASLRQPFAEHRLS